MGSNLKGKNLLLKENLSYKSRHHFERASDVIQGSKQEVTKVNSLCKTGRKI